MGEIEEPGVTAITDLNNSYTSNYWAGWSSSASGVGQLVIVAYAFDVDEDTVIEAGEARSDITLTSTDSALYSASGTSVSGASLSASMTRSDERDGPDVLRGTSVTAGSEQDQTTTWDRTVTATSDLAATDTLLTTTGWSEEDPAGNDDGEEPVVEFTSLVVDDLSLVVAGTFSGETAFTYGETDDSYEDYPQWTTLTSSESITSGVMSLVVDDVETVEVFADGTVDVTTSATSTATLGYDFATSQTADIRALERTGDGGESHAGAGAYAIAIDGGQAPVDIEDPTFWDSEGQYIGEGDPPPTATFAYEVNNSSSASGSVSTWSQDVVNLVTTATPIEGTGSGSGSGSGGGSASGPGPVLAQARQGSGLPECSPDRGNNRSRLRIVFGRRTSGFL